MPVDKTPFINSVKKIFDEGMKDAISEGLKASIKSENPIYSDGNITSSLEKTINQMAKAGADAAAQQFVDKVSEKLCEEIDKYVRLLITNTVATLSIPVKNIALTASAGGGPVAGSVNILPGDLKVQ